MCLVLVEYHPERGWFCRQLHVNIGEQGSTLYDLNVLVKNGKVVGHPTKVEAIVWGDIHVNLIDPQFRDMAWEVSALGFPSVIDSLRPKYQFFHDLFDGHSIQKYAWKNKDHHEIYRAWKDSGLHVEREIDGVVGFLGHAARKNCKSIIVNSNHDATLNHWLQNASHKTDPLNAIFYLEAELFLHRSEDPDPSVLAWAIKLSLIHI